MDGLFLQREGGGGAVFSLPPRRLHGLCCEVRLVGQSDEFRAHNRVGRLVPDGFPLLFSSACTCGDGSL